MRGDETLAIQRARKTSRAKNFLARKNGLRAGEADGIVERRAPEVDFSGRELRADGAGGPVKRWLEHDEMVRRKVAAMRGASPRRPRNFPGCR